MPVFATGLMDLDRNMLNISYPTHACCCTVVMIFVVVVVAVVVKAAKQIS